MSAKRGVLLLIAAFLLVMLWISMRESRHATTPPPAPPTPEQAAAREAAQAEVAERKKKASASDKDIKVLMETGLLRKIDVEMHEFYVEPSLWHATSIDTKNGIGSALASYVETHSEGQPWCNILDYRSGKRLAKYSRAWGLTVD